MNIIAISPTTINCGTNFCDPDVAHLYRSNLGSVKEVRENHNRPKHGVAVEALEVVIRRNQTVLAIEHLPPVECREVRAR